MHIHYIIYQIWLKIQLHLFMDLHFAKKGKLTKNILCWLSVFITKMSADGIIRTGILVSNV